MTNKDKKILITGASGFLGTNLINKLKENGYNNLIYPTHNHTELIIPNEVAALFEKTTPEIVIHLAAKCGGIGANMESPATFWYDNLMMGINVLSYSTIHKAKLILLGTTCSYPKFTQIPFKEENIHNGYPEETNAPYGIAKKTLMVGADAFHREYGLQYTCLIPTNMYGPYDNFNLKTSHVIPAMIRKFHEAVINKNPVITLWGDGTPTRDFLYVQDCVNAIIKSIELKAINDYINIGSGKEISMKQLSIDISDIIGYNGELVWDITKPNGQPKRQLDIQKAKRILGWEPKIDLFSGLIETYKWYEGNKK